MMRARAAGPAARIALLIAVAAPCLSVPLGARAAQTVELQTSFNPNRLGARTTIEFGFEVHSTVPGRAPSPVTDVDLHLPVGLGLATSTLGLANCEPGALLAGGVTGCPANARIGFGHATVAVPAEGEPIVEQGSLAAVVGPPNREHLEVLFYAEGHAPVFAQLVFPGLLLEDGGPFGDRLDTAIPLIPTWPGGPAVAVTSMTSTIGPRGLTYYRHRRGRIVPYQPRGIFVPRRCPRNGFPFRVDLVFMDGTHQTAISSVPCPHRRAATGPGH
jgi:hypothetical protein